MGPFSKSKIDSIKIRYHFFIKNEDTSTSNTPTHRSVHMRVVEPGIARRMSLFEEQKDFFMEELDRPPEVMDKEVMLVDVTKESQTRKGLRKVVIARRKRKGQPREAGVAVTRIDDMFRESGSSPMVTNTLGGNVGPKRKQLGEEQGSMVVDRKRQRGF